MCLYSITLINSLFFTPFITKLKLPKPARTNQYNMIIFAMKYIELISLTGLIGQIGII